jgi:hypothetical protein
MINHSSKETLNFALEDCNPFLDSNVKANQVWGQGFPDVETINAHASDTVFGALRQIQQGHLSTTSIVITAQDGTGKTHIISRIRHRIQNQGGGLFVYANRYGDYNLRDGFQKILSESLSKVGSEDVTQWQELATAMINQVQEATSKPTYLPKKLVEKVIKLEDGDCQKVNNLVKQATKIFRQKVKKVEDPDIVTAILWTLSDENSSYAIQWLGGEELSKYKSEELGLPPQRRSFNSVLQILDLISQYNQLIICFDELDFPDAYNEQGLHISVIVAGFIKDLVQNLNRGLILSVMMPVQWNERIMKLPAGAYSKVSAWCKPIDLHYMNGQSTVDLVTLWLKKFYESQNLVPPHPLYPFDEDQLQSLGKGNTVREVIKWCRDNCKPLIKVEPVCELKNPIDQVETAFQSELKEDYSSYLDDNASLSQALDFSFQRLIGLTVERVTLEEVTDKVTSKGKADGYISFKIIGKEDGKTVKIGVAILQTKGGKSLGAGLKKLCDYQGYDMTRGCLVRSPNRKISPHLIKKYITPLTEQQGGELVKLNEADIKPLLAIFAIFQKRQTDYGLSEEEVFKFMEEKGQDYQLGSYNPLLRDILSDPSGEIPEDMIEDEPQPKTHKSANNTSDDDDTDDLSDLNV